MDKVGRHLQCLCCCVYCRRYDGRSGQKQIKKKTSKQANKLLMESVFKLSLNLLTQLFEYWICQRCKCLKDVSPAYRQLSSFRSCLLRGLLFVLVLMYKFSILKLAANGVEGSTESQPWPVVSAKQPHCRRHPRPIGVCWPCWTVPNDSSSSPAQPSPRKQCCSN